MRIVAILASYNEEVFIRATFENYFRQGVEVYLLDNDSTDGTVEIAQGYLRHGLIGLERLPRRGCFELLPQLRRKEEIADEIKADWYIHADMDELRFPPASHENLASAIRDIDQAGFNTVNFKNFLFLPTQESPEHEHERFPETMLWYRYMAPSYPYQVKAWKRQKQWSIKDRVRSILRRKSRSPTSVNLTEHGGHFVRFEGARLSPYDFIMKHYQVLSLPHACRKYVQKRYSEDELKMGAHGWKGTVTSANLRLPSEREMHRFISNELLDTSDPITRSLIYLENP